MKSCTIDRKLVRKAERTIVNSTLKPEDTLNLLIKLIGTDINIYENLIQDLSSVENKSILSEQGKAFVEIYSNREELQKVLNQKTNKVLTNPKLDWLSRPVKDIFGTSTESYKYLINSFRASIFKAIFIDNSVKNGLVIGKSRANRNINDYINRLLKIVQDKLKVTNFTVLQDSDFENKYKALMNSAIEEIEKIDLSLIRTKSSIADLDFVNAVIILAKFDELLKQEFGNLTRIGSEYYGYFAPEGLEKYETAENPVKMALYLDGDEQRFISSNTQSNFFKMWVSTIPRIDAKGNIIPGSFLTGNEVLIAIGLMSRKFIDYWTKTRTVLSLNTNAEETLQTIFEDDFFKPSVEGDSVLRSLKKYLYESEKGVRFSIQDLLSWYRENIDSSVQELNLFNVLAFESSKSNIPILFMSEIKKNGTVVTKDLDIAKENGSSKLRDLIRQKIALDLHAKPKISNPFTKYSIDLDGKTLVSDLTETSDICPTLLYKAGNPNNTVTLINLLNKLFGIPKKELTAFTSTVNGLKYITELIVSINKAYNLEISEEETETETAERINLSSSVLDLGTFVYANDVSDIKMITYNGDKNAIPVSRMYSPMFSMLNFMDEMSTRFETDDACVFTKFPNLFTNQNNTPEDNKSGYKYCVGVNVDIKGKLYKVALSLTPKESLIHEILYGFVKSYQNGQFVFQPVAYSDKSTIFNIIVNLNANYDETKQFKDLSIDEIENLYYSVLKKYYEKIQSKILKNWKRIFELNLQSLLKGTTEDKLRTTLNNKLDSLDDLENAFNELKVIAESRGISLEQEIQNLIRVAFNKDSSLEIVEERDYSPYKDGIHVNKMLKSNIDLYKDDTPSDAWLEDQYKNYSDLMKFITEQKIDFSKITNSDIKSITGIEQDKESIELLSVFDLGKEHHGNDINPFFYKYLLMKNLFTDSFLNMSVGHPWIHKGKTKSTDDLMKEINNRCNTSLKRNNSLTATSEQYLTNGRNTIISNINVSIITDHLAEVFNISGSYDDGLEATNGSIYVPGWVSKLMENALPARGQRGVQKNILLHTGMGYATQIKDAQQIVSNELIRMTAYNDKSKQINWKKMLSKSAENLDLSDIDLSGNPAMYTRQTVYYNYAGKYYRIEDIQKTEENNTEENKSKYTITATEVDVNGNPVQIITLDESGNVTPSNNVVTFSQNIKNVYDLWQVLGGEYSLSLLDGRLELSEASMDGIAAYMSEIKNEQDDPQILLKDIIHMFCFSSAIKMGLVNVNQANNVLYNTSTEKLMYFKMSLEYSGLQNDKNHAVNEDSIREMSQVISALAQGNETMYLAQEAYNEIAEFTQARVAKFARLNHLNISKKPDKFYEEMSKFILDAFRNADHISGGTAIAKMMEKEKFFVTSDSQIYNKFVSAFISELNNSAIKRKYTGLAGILCPSDGAIKVFEKNGQVYLMSDIFRFALSQADEIKLKINPDGTKEIHNENIIKHYISENFTDEEITDPSTIKLGDTVYFITKEGQTENIEISNPLLLSTYSVRLKDGTRMFKVTSIPRDLKPAEHTWNIGDEQYNIWSSPLVTLGIKVQLSKGVKVKSGENETILKYIELEDDNGNKNPYLLTNSKLAKKDGAIYSDKYKAWLWKLSPDEDAIYRSLEDPNVEVLQLLTQRYTIALNHGRGIQRNNWWLKIDALNAGNFDELDEISNYNFTEAECIFPDTYFEKLGTKGKTLSELLVKNDYNFFKKGVSKSFDSDVSGADFVINTENGAFGVLIAEEDLIAKSSHYIVIDNDIKTYKDAYGDRWVINENGDNLYKLTPGIKRVYNTQNQTEYILVSPNSINSLSKFLDTFLNINSVLPKFNSEGIALRSFTTNNVGAYINLFDLLKKINDISFKPLFDQILSKLKALSKNEQDLRSKVKKYEKLSKEQKQKLTNEEKEEISKTYSDLNAISKDKIKFACESFVNDFEQAKLKFIDKLAKQRLVTLKQVLHVLSARIPAQSLQSFMAMNNVGFTQNQLNNIYVSRWQIWIQGSDFDIDVAYNLMYSIDSLGRLEMHSPLANTTTEALYEASKLLPKPNHNLITESNIKENKEVDLKGKRVIEISNLRDGTFIINEPNEVQLNYIKILGTQTINDKECVFVLTEPTEYALSSSPRYTRTELIETYPWANCLKSTKFVSGSGIDITADVAEWAKLYNSDSEEDLLQLIDLYIKILSTIDSDFEITINTNNLLKLLNVINAEQNLNLNVIDVQRQFIDIINSHNRSTPSKGALKNNILTNARNISNNILNMLSSYTSVDGSAVKRIKDAIENLGLENSLGQIHDGAFIFKMLDANYVGKKTVGIYANAIKGYFALKSYYDKKGVTNYLNKQIIIPLKNKNQEIEPYVLDVSRIAGSVSGDNFDAILTLSALLTLATDNAKELGLAKINAGMEFAGSYGYLTILGVPIEKQIEFFTSPAIKRVTELVKGNIFKDRKKTNIPQAIKKVKEELKDSTDPNAELYKQLLNSLSVIYESAQELRTLTGLLGINQGLKNKSNELIKFKQDFTNLFINRIGLVLKSDDDETIQLIKKLNPNVDIEYVEQLLEDARKLNIIDENNICKNVDFNKFFLNSSYQKIIVKLYDLVKDTFNIYECLAQATVFSKMLQLTAIFDSLMQKASIKHKESSNILARLRNYKFELPENALVYGSVLKSLTTQQVSKVQKMIEHKIITSWLGSSDLNKFLFNKADILSLVGENVRAEDNVSFNLKTYNGVMMFKSLMETVIIPLILKQDPLFSTNEFVNRLVLYTDKYSDDKWFKLNVNLSAINTGTSLEINQDLLDGYNDLRHKRSIVPSNRGLTEFTWGELLYVYNMIANKNLYGPQRMSAIFEQQIETDPIAKSYLKFATEAEKAGTQLTDDELLFALYAEKDDFENMSLELSGVKTVEQNYSSELSDDVEQSSTNLEEEKPEETESIKAEEKEETKNVEITSYLLTNESGPSGFLNFIKRINSDLINGQIELNDKQLRYLLLSFLMNGQALIKLNCD